MFAALKMFCSNACTRSVFTCTDVKTEKQCVLKIRVKKTDDRAFRAITERMLRMPRVPRARAWITVPRALRHHQTV